MPVPISVASPKSHVVPSGAMVPSGSRLVLWKPHGVPATQSVGSVKLAVGRTFPGIVAGLTVTLLMTVSFSPAASLTISLTGTVPSAVKVNDASLVLNSSMPSPVKSQPHPVTATLSVLGLAVKAQAVPTVQVGAVKMATGAVVSVPVGGGSSPPQADPSA